MRASSVVLVGMSLVAGGCSRNTSSPKGTSASKGTAPKKQTGLGTHTSPPLLKTGAKGSNNSIAVLTWHRIAEKPDQYTVTTPAKFAEELAFLYEEGATVMRLEDAVKMVKAGQPLPPRAVSLGFDDGFRSCYTEVFPLLKKYNWPATLYVYPDWISSGAGALTWDMLKEMQKSGLVDVQSHTMGHPNLVKMRPKHGMTYEQRLHHEIFDSKTTLEAKLGTKVTQIAYPYGIYNKHIMAQSQAAGYDTAWTVNAGPFSKHFTRGQTWMSLPRFLIYRNTSFATFARYAFGKPLDISRAYPAANSTLTQSPKSISVHIDESVDPKSVQMRLSIVQKVNTEYNAKTRVLTYRLPEDLREGVWTVSVSATDKKKQPKTVAWAFNIKAPATDALHPVGETSP